MTDDKLFTSFSASTIIAKLTTQSLTTGQTYNIIELTNTIHLTMKMTSGQVIETSVTNNNSFQNYPHPDDHTIRTTDTAGFKPFTMVSVQPYLLRIIARFHCVCLSYTASLRFGLNLSKLQSKVINPCSVL